MASPNGGVPPGFRFHPTDEELLHYYLRKKLSFQKFDMEVIREVDLNKIEPWDLQERCKIGSTPQNEWYFFSHKDRKYPTGSRTNRATNAGFWKATGRDKCIRNSYKKIGMRKTLVFYRGRAPHGQKTDWIMHEYRHEDGDDPHSSNSSSEDGWVVCRVFKKKNLFKGGGINEGRGSSSMSMGSDNHNQLNKASSPSNQPPRTSSGGGFGHSHNHHPYPFSQQHHDQHHSQQIINHHQQLDLYKFSYSNIPVAAELPYPHRIQAQNFIPTHKSQHLAYECESGTLNLRYQQQAPPCEAHEATQITAAERDEGLNEWGMMDHRLLSIHNHHQLGHEEDSSRGVIRSFEDAAAVAASSSNTSSMQQINQLSLRGEMDFWGYDK